MISKIHDLNPGKIAVFRALQLGDLLCSVPAFRALRRQFPHAHITYIGLPWARTFVERYRCYIDSFLEFPGYPGLPEIPPDIGRIPGFFAAAQHEKFDLAVQMHGSGSYVNSIVQLLGAKTSAGFYLKNEYCPDHDTFLQYPENESEIWQQLRLLQYLGVRLQGDHLEFPLLPQDTDEYAAIDPHCRPKTKDYVVIHPGARFLSRRWSVERFAHVADTLAESGYEIVLTGSKDETDLVRTAAACMKSPACNLAGKTTLGSLSYLLKGAKLLICNDTGVSHLAAALDVPSVVLVLGSDPDRWAPLDSSRHKALYRPMECRPCYFNECPLGHPCAELLTEQEVTEAARQLLSLTPEKKELFLIGNFRGVYF